MGGTLTLDTHYNNILRNAADTANLAAENVDVANHALADKFIVCVQVTVGDPCNKASDSTTVKLQFSKDGGGWLDVAVGQELIPAADVDVGITDGDPVAAQRCGSTPTGCGGAHSADGYESCGADCTTPAFALATEAWTECHFGVDPAGATGGSYYEFRLWNIGDGIAMTPTLPAMITMAVAPVNLVMTNGGAYHDHYAAENLLWWVDNTFHLVRVDNGVDIDIVEVIPPIELVITDSGVAYHDLIDWTQSIWWVQDTYHEVYSPELPATQVYPDDAYHSIFTNVDNSPIDLIEVNILVMSDAGMNYHLVTAPDPLWWIQNTYHDLVDVPPYAFSVLGAYHDHVVTPTNLTLVESGAIDLIMTDGGAYHLHVPSDPLWWPSWCYHDLVDVGLYVFSVLNAYHDHVAGEPYAFSVLGAYHLHAASEPYAFSVLNAFHLHTAEAAEVFSVRGAWHEHAVVPTNLTLVTEGVYNIVFTDGGVNYHDLVDWAQGIWWVQDCYHIHDGDNIDEDEFGQHFTRPASAYHTLTDSGPLWWIQNAYHVHTAEAADVFSVEGTYHDHVVIPTNLTVVEVGDVTLTMTDGGAYHVTYSPELPATQVYPDIGVHDHVITPSDITLVEVKDLTIAPDPYHDLITKDEVWFVQETFHEFVTDPTDLTLDITHILAVNACFHVIEDGAPFALVHILNLVMSDAGLNYHAHVVTPTDLTISELGPVDLLNLDAAHVHTAPNLRITTISAVVIDVADAIRTLVDLTTSRTLHLL